MSTLNVDEINSELEKFDAWNYDEEASAIVSAFEFENFREAMDFAAAVGDVAENVGHHPDILVHDFKFVTIFTRTHEPDGITKKDIELVKAIEDNLEFED